MLTFEQHIRIDSLASELMTAGFEVLAAQFRDLLFSDQAFQIGRSFHLLELPVNSQLTDCKKAYRKLALKYHPDRHPEGALKMQELNWAYKSILTPHWEIVRKVLQVARSKGFKGSRGEELMKWARSSAAKRVKTKSGVVGKLKEAIEYCRSLIAAVSQRPFDQMPSMMALKKRAIECLEEATEAERQGDEIASLRVIKKVMQLRKDANTTFRKRGYHFGTQSERNRRQILEWILVNPWVIYISAVALVYLLNYLWTRSKKLRNKIKKWLKKNFKHGRKPSRSAKVEFKMMVNSLDDKDLNILYQGMRATKKKYPRIKAASIQSDQLEQICIAEIEKIINE
jgi:DnaJ domain